MSNADQEAWLKVKERLRAEVGDDVYSSWFARMEVEATESDTVRLSVPTRFLKSWIQSHYAERVLACWQKENDKINRVEIIVRSAVLRSAVPIKPKDLEPAMPFLGKNGNGNGRPLQGDNGHEALGGSPLDARLTFETFVIGRSNAARPSARSARRG